MPQNDNVLFPLSSDRMASVVEYKTGITMTGGGGEQRVIEWDEGLINFNAVHGVRSLKDLQTLNRFHRARKGRGRAFLVRDLLDYEATQELFGVGDGATTEFQLIKTYSDADEYGNGAADVRRITRPEVGAVIVFVNGVPLAEGVDYVCNYTNGKIQFVVIPVLDALLTWSGQFFVPVRFTEDKLPADEIYYRLLDPSGPKGAGSIPDVTMREVRG